MKEILGILQNGDGGGKEVSNLLIARECTLVKVVESLEELLVSTESKNRLEGVRHLASVLQKLPSDSLSVDETKFIASFLLDRANDHFSVLPAVIRCILAVVVQKNLSDDILARLVRCLYNDMHAQSMVFEDRHMIITIFHEVLVNRPVALESMGSDFVNGFLQSVDGEKEPRCLLLALKSSHLLCSRLDITTFAEELFEVISCYFPVDFSPPPSELGQGHGITRDMLGSCLSACLTSSVLFAGRVIPLALEKLDSQLLQAQLDAIDLLQRCCRAFPASAVTPHLAALRSSITRVWFAAEASHSLQQAAVALVRCVSTVANSCADGAREWYAPLVDQCVHMMSQREQTEGVPACGQLLCELAAFGSDAVLAPALPTLCAQLESGGGDVQWRTTVLAALATLLALPTARACVASQTAELPNRLAAVLLAPLSDTVSSSSSSEAHWSHTCAAFTALAEAPWLITSSNDAAILCDRLSVLALAAPDSQQRAVGNARSALLVCAAEFGRQGPLHVLSHIVRPLAAEVVSSDVGRSSDDCLELLCACARHESCVRELAPLLLARAVRLGRACHDGLLQTLGALHTLVCETINDAAIATYLVGELRLIDKLLELFGAAAREVPHVPGRPAVEIESSSSQVPLYSTQALELTAHVLMIVCRSLSLASGARALASCVSLFLQQNGEPDMCQLAEKWKLLAPLLHHSPWQHTQLVVLLAAVLASVKMPDVQQQEGESCCPVPQLEILSVLLTKLALKKRHGVTSEWAAKSLAALANKLAPTLTSGFIEKMAGQVEFVWSQARETGEWTAVGSAVHLWTLVTKALVLAGHEKAGQFVDRLLDWLEYEYEDLGEDAAGVLDKVVCAFETLIADDSVINAANHCRVRLLYRQWIFGVVWPRIAAHLAVASHSAGCNDGRNHTADVIQPLPGSGSSGGGAVGSDPSSVHSVEDSQAATAEGRVDAPGLSVLRRRVACLRVLAALLAQLPAAAVSQQLPQLVAPLTAGLQQLTRSSSQPSTSVAGGRTGCEQLGEVCLQLLTRTASERVQLLEQHVDTLVPHLLDAAVQCCRWQQRVEALCCLRQLAELPVFRLVPLKKSVCQRLQQCVGDRKRLVRQQAVDTRNAWFLVGALGASR